jgi:hypothetical protein
MNAADIAAALAAAHRYDRWCCCPCPIHGSRSGHSSTLAFRDGDRGLIIYCHAGCSVADILAELRRRGLTDLFLEPTRSSAADSITVLRANGRRLAKTIHRDGTIDQYDRVRTVDLIAQPLADLTTLEKLLRYLEQRRDCAVVRGTPVDPMPVKTVRRLLYGDCETGQAPTLVEVPRRCVTLGMSFLSPRRPLGTGS